MIILFIEITLIKTLIEHSLLMLELYDVYPDTLYR